ncbi:MAG TPA: SUMF1/EgtB/PvdO family nonheme iron enzyme [Alphaproteobacteria bacterium]|nr:SUMF1/EgtB/PvdO family nonheme iron enzyme [Alphaproteobacteria bacterium]
MTASRPRGAECQGCRAVTEAMAACRHATLALIADLDDEILRAQPDPLFSPIGWHIGHIAYTEALWLAPSAVIHPEWETIFRQDGLPKAARRALPPRSALLDYLAEARRHAMARAEAALAAGEERLWRFILQHEAQHGETIAIIRRLSGLDLRLPKPVAADDGAMIEIPAGTFHRGDDGIAALDNERPAHPEALPAYRLSRRPVSQRRFRDFILAGGYRTRRFWSDEGWRWRTAHGVTRPLYWRAGGDDVSVHGVSAYEAEAYCRFIGMRLPSEAEWERAANLAPSLAMLGEVWQWTSTVFAAYPGFQAFPYPGYSRAYFDGRHRVLKGGSWATQAPVLRPSFRNWYEPGTRQIFAGFRYADDASSPSA